MRTTPDRERAREYLKWQSGPRNLSALIGPQRGMQVFSGQKLPLTSLGGEMQLKKQSHAAAWVLTLNVFI